jgi:zinc transport system substrate-binding protein
MRRLLIVPLLALVAGGGTDDPSVTAAQRGKPVIVTALHPLAEAIHALAGSDVVVIDLIPVDELPHDYELTPRQRDVLVDADLAVLIGGGFQPYILRAASRREGPTLEVRDALRLPDRPDGSDGPPDPHIWLDPTLMGSVVTAIGEAVAEVVPDHATRIRSRAAKIVEQNVELDAQIKQGLEDCDRTMIVSHHESFGWFAARYDLTNIGVDGPSPDDDPSTEPANVARVERLLDEDPTITTLFVEPLSLSPWITVTADERDLDTASLDPYEGLSLAEEADDVTYRSVLLYDLQVLEDHLGCEPS